ncbi:MAG: polyphosphate kinase, partial [Sphingomonadales bacterium]
LDPKVLGIKMTIYRTSEGTKIINHLIDAARRGKQVTVVVELKARFDEEANIRWANRLEEEGIHVTYGVVGLKTHCKAILVIRRDYSGLRRYAHLGTGNYHAGTARIYSDLGLLTCAPEIGRDLTNLFNYLTTGSRLPRGFEKILTSPKKAKKEFIKKIHRETKIAEAGNPALIRFKCNAIHDAEIGRALYEAGQKGVKIELIIRDSCCLIPGRKDFSENISVRSIIGRFLEHTRIYYFHNGGAEEYFMGSADMMRRNLESRVEILTPIEEPAHREELKLILDTQMADTRNAWEMRPNGSYKRLYPEEGVKTKGSQEVFIKLAQKREKAAKKLSRRKTKGVATRIAREV